MSHVLVTGTHRSGTTFVASMLALAPGTRPLFEALSPARGPFEKWFQYIGVENESAWREPLSRALARGRGLLGSWRAERLVVKEPTAVFAAEWMADRLGMTPVLTLRHPAAFVASNRRLGWAYHVQDLLDQPLLLQGYLAGMEDELRRAAASPDQVVHLGLLWKAVYGTVADLQRRRPGWVFLRHEDVSLRPVPVLEEVYRRLGLEMTPEARRAIVEHTTRPGPYGPPDVADIHRDSAAHLRDWERLLAPEEVARLRELTEPVASRFYADADW